MAVTITNSILVTPVSSDVKSVESTVRELITPVTVSEVSVSYSTAIGPTLTSKVRIG